VVPVVGGPSGVFPTGEWVVFLDSVWNWPYALWHWESEVDNPNRFPVVFRVAFFAPGRVVVGWLGLLPGWSFHIDIHVQDGPLTGPEVGYWTWIGASWLKYPISKDTSVTERRRLLVKHPTGPDDEDVPYRYEFISPSRRPAVPGPGVFFLPDVVWVPPFWDQRIPLIGGPDPELVFQLIPGIYQVPPWRKIEPFEIPPLPLRD